MKNRKPGGADAHARFNSDTCDKWILNVICDEMIVKFRDLGLTDSESRKLLKGVRSAALVRASIFSYSHIVVPTNTLAENWRKIVQSSDQSKLWNVNVVFV